MYRVAIDRNRPDFRVFIDLLYGADRNVDTDGDSNPVNSRTWNYLYIADRESDDPSVEISAVHEQPSVFEVESQSPRLEELAALYLFMYCGTTMSYASSLLSPEQIQSLKAKYVVEFTRANAALWH
jgi:hypothetical protein